MTRSTMNGEAFRKLRIRKGFKERRDLIDFLGCYTIDAVRKWETGKRSIPMMVVDKLKEKQKKKAPV